MSSFKGVIIINGKKRPLLQAEYILYRLKDMAGLPTTPTLKTPIYAMVESTRYDEDLYDLMFSPTATFNGELIFYDRDGMKTLVRVEIHKGHIVGLTEEFDSKGSLPMHIKLFITCGAIKIQDVKMIEKWVFDDPFVVAEPIVYNEMIKKPQVTECYYTDLEGNKQAEPQTGQEVYVVLKTENMVGDTTNIDLSNHTKDFIYNGEVIEDDIIKDFNVTSDLHKIKLRVIAQQNGEKETIKN